IVATNHHLASLDLGRFGAGTDQQFDAPLEKILLEDGGDLRVTMRQDLLARHHQGDLGPERLEYVDELDTGDARPDHDDVLWYLRQVVGVAGGENPLPIDRRPRGHPRHRSRGDERLVEGDPPFAIRRLDRGGVSVDQRSPTLHQFHRLGLEELDEGLVYVACDRLDTRRQVAYVDGS